MINSALSGKKKQPIWMYVIGGVCAAYGAYLLNACYQPGRDINYVMERLNIVLGAPFADYWNGTSLKAIVGGLFLYFIILLMYMTSQKKYMQGKEFGTAVFAEPGMISKKIADKDEANNRILSQNVRMSMNTRKTRLNLNYLVIGGSGAGKSATRLQLKRLYT